MLLVNHWLLLCSSKWVNQAGGHNSFLGKLLIDPIEELSVGNLSVSTLVYTLCAVV